MMLFCCREEAMGMAKRNGGIKAAIRDIAIIVAGLAGAFVFFLVVVGVIVGLPVAEVFCIFAAMGSGLP